MQWQQEANEMNQAQSLATANMTAQSLKAESLRPKAFGQKLKSRKLHDSKLDAFQPRSTSWYSDLLIIESISEDCGDGG